MKRDPSEFTGGGSLPTEVNMTETSQALDNGSNGIHADAPPGDSTKSPSSKKDGASSRRTADIVVYELLCESLSPLLMDRWDPQDMVDTLVFGKRSPPDRETPLEVRCVDKIYRNEEGQPIFLNEHIYACLVAAGRSIKVGKEGKLSTAKDSKLFSVLEIKEDEIPLIFTPGRSKKQPAEAGKNPLSDKPWKGFSRVKVANPISDEVEGDAEPDPDRQALAEATASLPEEVFGPELDEQSPWRVDVKRGVGKSGIPNAIVRPCFEEWSFKITVEVDYTGLEGLTSAHIQQLFEKAGKRVGLLSYNPAHKGPYGRFRVASMTEVSSRNT